MAEQIEGAAAEAAPEPDPAVSAGEPAAAATLPAQDLERSDAPSEAAATAQGSTGDPAAEAEPEPPSPVVLRWLERHDIFNSGIPNRDVTEADALAPDLLELAVESGTHERIG